MSEWESYLAMNGWVILRKGDPTPLLHTHSDDTGPEVNATVREHNRVVRDLAAENERLAEIVRDFVDCGADDIDPPVAVRRRADRPRGLA